MKFQMGFIKAGAAAPPTITTWNPADKAATIVLSAGNLAAEAPAGTGAGTFESARGTTSHAAGKWYYEGTINAALNVLLGWGKATANLNSYAGADANGYGYYGTGGGVYSAAALVGGAQAYGVGNVVRLAMDLTNNRIWVSVVGQPWNGSGAADPATNVGGIAITAGAYFPMFSGEGFASDKATANFGASSFVNTPPVGFLAWG